MNTAADKMKLRPLVNFDDDYRRQRVINDDEIIAVISE